MSEKINGGQIQSQL